MPYDEDLAARVRELFERRKGIVEKKMFGGIGWLLCGNMCVGVWKDSLIARVGADDTDAALAEPHTRPFDITGKAMTGWVLVDPGGLAEDDELAAWVQRAVAFVTALPHKTSS